MRRSGPVATVLALLLAAWLAPAALACTVEGGPFPLSGVLKATSVTVEGTVVSAAGGIETPVVIEVSVERVLRGSSAGDTVTVRNWGNCPFHPRVGERVVVAATADGEVTGAWILNGAAAQEWIPTDPPLITIAAIDDAFKVPDTATLSSVPRARAGSSSMPLLLAIWAVCVLGFALVPPSRRASQPAIVRARPTGDRPLRQPRLRCGDSSWPVRAADAGSPRMRGDVRRDPDQAG